MIGKERYFIFGIGVLIGCAILAISYAGKYNAAKLQKEKDLLNGYKPSSSIIPGKDLTAKKPFDLAPALFTKDLEQDEEGKFLRIIIAQGSGKESPICRIVETLWRDTEDLTREKLICRQIMSADKIVVRLKKDNDDIEKLKQELSDFNMTLLGEGRGPQLYTIQLPSYDIDVVPQAIEVLTAKSHLIEAAFPNYLQTL